MEQQGSLYRDETERPVDGEKSLRKESMLNQLLTSERTKSKRRHILVASAVSLVASFAFVLMYFYLRSKDSSSTSSAPIDRSKECGSSPDEGIARGCTFDQLSMLWLPPEVSRLGTAQFRAQGGPTGWQYWSDMAGQNKIANISTHKGQYFTTNREHLAHCAFHLLRVSDALRDKVTYDFKVYAQHHNRHCAMMLLNASMQAPADGLDFIGTASWIGYGSTLPVQQNQKSG